MGPSEGRWDPWGQTRAGVLKAVLVLLLLDFTAAQTTAPKASCGNAAAPKNVSQPGYMENIVTDTGAGFMSLLVQSFLNTVQPHPFPHDLILLLTKEFNKFLSDQDTRMAVLRYETGFLVCVAIGIVYIVLMPLVGIFMALCRCCGNCGGEMYQKQTSSIHCWRRTLYWSLFVTTAILLAGNVCMFKSNQVFMVSVDHGQEELIKTIDNLQTYITAVPEQIHYVVNASYKTVNEVTENLDDIGPELGSLIQQSFKGPLKPALDSVVLLDQDAVKTIYLLKTLNKTVDKLQRSSDGIQANISAVRDKLTQTIRRPDCLQCAQLEPELQKLTVDTTLVIPNLSGIQNAVDEIIKAELQSVADDYLKSIPQRVTNATITVVESSKTQLEMIEKQISQVVDGLPIPALKEISNVLVQVEQDINRFSRNIEDVNHIKWAVGVAICCLVLLVVVCNVLGLILGPAGLEPHADPRDRSCTSGCGGTFLMMGAGFSFLFCWLFMLLVLLLFILGGNLFTLGCKPWHNGELLQVIDASDLVPSLPNNVTLGGIHRDCRLNLPIWETLNLSQSINLEELLNVSQYTSQILWQFENMNIDLSTVTLLSPEVEKQLSDFPEQLKQLDFITARAQMTNITRTNLNETADKLDNFATLQSNPGITAELQDAATDLRAIQTDIETIIFPQIANLTLLINDLEAHAVKINGTVAMVSREVGAAQVFMDTNTTLIVKAESRAFINCQIQLFEAYANWAILMLTEELGRCGPVSGAVDSAALIICSNLVESLNAFWFSLGWCMIFFIPSIIFSIKLSKYYRKMKRADELNKHIAMNQIPRATMLQY